MATLETIRNKAGVLITGFIGLALVAFVLSDLLTPGKSMFSNSSNDIAKVDGTSITYNEYQNKLTSLEEWTKLQYNRQSLDENTSNRLMDQNWDQVIRETIMNSQYEELGITVTDKEISYMFSAATAHPAIKQMFTNPKTGMYDEMQSIQSYQTRANNPQANFFWNYLIQSIKTETLYTKYMALVSKGLYTTKSQLDELVAAKQKKVDFDYILKPYESISDSTIKISDSEIKNYYNNHQKDFKREPSRDIKYVTFDVAPSEEDNNATREIAEKAKVRFANAETDVAQFLNRNSDNAPYNATNVTLDQVNSTLLSFVTNGNQGDVYGPYFEDGSYKLTRIAAIKQLPDSVKARHILIRNDAPNAAKSADSILALAKGGADFASLARQNSIDEGSAINGGDLGWFTEGKMVKPFNDACFAANTGDIVKVESQFGWHIINIQEKGKLTQKYELGTFEKRVIASQKTRQMIYSAATKFATENKTPEKFDAAVKQENLAIRYGNGLKKNDRNIGSLETPRQLVKWAFESDVKDISPIMELGNQFVIAMLVKQSDSEYASVIDARDQIKSELIKDKKAEMMIEEFNQSLKASQSLSSVAQKMNLQVQSASSVTFASPQIQGAGFAPSLVAVATQTATGQISQPVKGVRGVYVVKVNNVQMAPADAAAEKSALAQETSYKVYRAYDALKEKYEITDNRSNFY